MNKIRILLASLLPIKKTKVLQILALLFLSSCIYESFDSRLKIVNQTTGDFSLDYSISDTIPEYPSLSKTAYYLSDTVGRKDTMSLDEADGKDWPFAIDGSKTKKLNLFIYSLDSIKKYKEIDTLINRKIYKRLEYSKEELEKSNWIVIVRN